MTKKKPQRLHKIYCKACGKIRWVRTANWKQVQHCEACAYRKKAEYNSAYIKAWRERKKNAKKQQ